jgi:hypothetical protein
MNNILVLFFIVICDVLGTIPQLFWFSHFKESNYLFLIRKPFEKGHFNEFEASF